MDLKLKDKVAFVGGSSKGIGYGIAKQLAAEGAKLVLCARNRQQLEQAAESIRSKFVVEVLPIAADLSSLEQVRMAVQQAVNHFKLIDILIVNSGGPKPGRFFDLNDQDWTSAHRSVLLYVLELYQLLIPLMKKQGWGRIINISSLSVKEPEEHLLLSNVFRSAVVSLAKSISKELYPFGITINNICPGAFKTDRAIQLMQSKAEKEGKTIEQVEQEVTSSLPGKKFSSIEDIGYLAAFLASDLAKEITGTTIQIDQGLSKGLF
ncbi:MAG TPA: SDR family oxidoreductase [Candidatus Nanoarchaeia archaeon]|nr:SDR family oxidoreductase [Candidatus Nanoarchaeia archaeon]